MKKDSNNIKIFWSWQSDSSTTCNRNFIESCLKKAISKIKKNSAQLIEIDRDTKGVGGTPRIADTILEKIREADLFIWDATLCYEKPRPAPNPNVLFELGYAISHLGEKRIIGVMNIANGLDGNFLPFDLKHRRWPIAYALNQESNFKKRITKLFKYDFGYEKKKKTEAEKLSDILLKAIQDALIEPKVSIFPNDIDSLIVKTYWDKINSMWINNWYNWRMDDIKKEHLRYLNIFYDYIRLAELPENIFQNDLLKNTHSLFIQSIKEYLNVQSKEMMPIQGVDGIFMVTVKASGRWIENYDVKYQQQCDKLEKKIEDLKIAWDNYVMVINKYYPEILRSGIEDADD